MSGLAVAVLGAGVGLGLLVVLRAFRRQQMPLTELAGTLSATGRSVADTGTNPGTDSSGPAARRWAAGMVESLTVGDTTLLRNRLRILDKTMEQHAFEKLTASVAGFVLPVALMVMVWAAGIRPPVLVLLLLSIALAVSGFLYPDLPLKDAVDERRRSFRHALGAYLELVGVMLAGGAGTQTALAAAAESGDGWAFAELRRAIDRASASKWRMNDGSLASSGRMTLTATSRPTAGWNAR